MRTTFITLLFLFATHVAQAYEPVLVDPETPFEIHAVESIEEESWYVGELNDFPHTFEFELTGPETLEVQVMVLPETEESLYTSLIAVKEVERGVTEVMRRTAKNETWNAFFDEKSKIEFLESSEFSEELEPGVYRVEVSNPVNAGKYVLKMGSKDDGGYFDTVGDIKQLRNYLGFNTIGMITNPYIFMPLFIIFSLGFFGWFFRRRKIAVDASL